VQARSGDLGLAPAAPMLAPSAIALADRRLMALARRRENWRSSTGERMRSLAIVTTAPNELCAKLHNRMPVVLGPELEMIGDIVPRDHDKFRYSWVRGAVGHEAQYERLCLIEKGRDDVYMSDDGSFPGRAGLSRHSRFDQRALAHVERSFVNVAARLEGIAEPGGICLSEDVFRQVRSRSAIPA